MARKCLPVDRGSAKDNNPLRTIWMPLIMTDPVLFQATANFAAVHLDILQGRPNQPSTLRLKTETINMINLKLRSAQEATNDSTIGAVALLAGMEVIHSYPTLSVRYLTEEGLTSIDVRE